MVKSQKSKGGALARNRNQRRMQRAIGSPIRKPQQQLAQPSARGMVLNIANESLRYGNSLCEPDKYPGAGVPAFPSLPTLKQGAFARGVLFTGSQSLGSIAVAPEQGSVNDSAVGAYTSSTYSGTVIGASGTAGVQNFTTNAVFDTVQINATTAGTRSRLVSAMLRVRYIGTELNRGGTIMSLQQPEHLSISGMGANALLAYKTAKKTPVTREWTTVHFCPLNYNFITALNTEPAATFPDAGNRFMGFLIESSPGNTFEFEFHANYEYEGVNVRGKTLCPADPTALPVFQATMNSVDPISHGNNSQAFHVRMWDRFKELFTKSVTWVGQEMKGIATKALPLVAEAAVSAIIAV